MAIHGHSTTAPSPQRGLLRAFVDAQPVPMPALTPETVAMLDACHGDTPTLLPASVALPGSGDLNRTLPMRLALALAALVVAARPAGRSVSLTIHRRSSAAGA